jgi:alkanesulfonate monooxygenase SsuD/methylene tetrahydromethanopterin reductase-like flavin-dependent oxidoreductase (luciferase family)
MPKVLFGIDVPANVRPSFDPVHSAQEAETLGFDFVSTNDHVLGPEPRYEGWTLLSWLAASTTRIGVAARVIGVPYREPVLLAKMAETFDRLSGGRLVLGLGAGSGESEFASMGLVPGPIGTRIAALEDAIVVLRGLWTERTFSHEGPQYTVTDAEVEPKPGRHIPIWLGTIGPRGLDLVGRTADGWIPSISYAPPDRAAVMIERLVAAAKAAGRKPDDISRIYNVPVSFGDTRDPWTINGAPSAVIEQLRGFLRMGFTGFNFVVAERDRSATVERLANDVVAPLRASQ